MIFQYTWEKVISGEKTITSRIAKPEPDGVTIAKCEMLRYPGGAQAVCYGSVDKDGYGVWRTKWQVGKTYAIQPARTAKSIGRIRVGEINSYDVRDITAGDVRAEGFDSKFQFLWTWVTMHDTPACTRWQYTGGHEADYREWLAWLRERPDERYQAWQLHFELVK